MCQLFYPGLKTRSQKFCYFTTSNAFEGNRYARHSKNMYPIQNLRIELTKYSVNYNRKPRQNWSLLSPLPIVIILLVQDNAAGEFHPLTREAVTPQRIACAKQLARELPEHSWVAIFSGSTHPWFLQSIRSRPRHVSTAKAANARLTTK